VVKVEVMEQEEALVVAVVVRGDVGNNLPQVSFYIILHLKGTLSRFSFRIMGLSHGFLNSGFPNISTTVCTIYVGQILLPVIVQIRIQLSFASVAIGMGLTVRNFFSRAPG
jgi:hypothetical protein